MASRKRPPPHSSRDPRAGWDYITPTHGKLGPEPFAESPAEAQVRGEAAARRVADDVSRNFMFDERIRTMEKEVCNEMRQRARDLVVRGDPSMPIVDRERVAAPTLGTPQADAFWRGFDWQIKQKFGCVCRPMDEPCADDEGSMLGLGCGRGRRR
jgi:hypothetical protein